MLRPTAQTIDAVAGFVSFVVVVAVAVFYIHSAFYSFAHTHIHMVVARNLSSFAHSISQFWPQHTHTHTICTYTLTLDFAYFRMQAMVLPINLIESLLFAWILFSSLHPPLPPISPSYPPLLCPTLFTHKALLSCRFSTSNNVLNTNCDMCSFSWIQ